MPEAGRSGDEASIEQDSHGCPCCPHGTAGGATAGSGDVLINGRKALRLGDQGKHGGCCGPSSWRAAMGWSSVLVNGKPIHCKGDATEHCGGLGALSAGSSNVLVGSFSSGSGAGGGTAFALFIDTPMFLQVPIEGVYISPQQTIESLKAFRHGFEAGLMMLAGQAAQVAAKWGLGRLFRLIDRVWEPLGSVLEKVVLLFGDYIPGISEVLRWVRILVQSVIMNQLLYAWRAQARDGPCPPQHSVGPPPDIEKLTLSAQANEDFVAAEANSDVSKHVGDLLDEFKPVFVEHPDDHRALAMEELVKNSTLVPLHKGDASNPKTLEDYHAAILELESQNPESDFAHRDDSVDYKDRALGALYINDDFAHDPGPLEEGEQPVYYGRAIKCSNTKIVLHYVALRSASFFPGPFIDDTMWAHEGDGEGVRVIIRRQDGNGPWLLAGLLFTSKHYRRNCSCGPACEGELPKKDPETAEEKRIQKTGCVHCNDCEDPFLPNNKMNVACEVYDDNKRPVVYIAIGSHAMGPTSGARHTVNLSIDHFPEHTPKTRIDVYDLRKSNEQYVRKTVFTRRVIWGSKTNWDDFAAPPSGHHEIEPSAE